MLYFDKFATACVADKREKIFVCCQFDIFTFLSALRLTSRENIWYLYLVNIMGFEYSVIIIGFDSYNDY